MPTNDEYDKLMEAVEAVRACEHTWAQMDIVLNAAKAHASLLKEQSPCDHRWHGDYPPFRCAACGVTDPRSYITENEVYRKQQPAPAVEALTEVDDRLMAECDQWKEQCDNQCKTIDGLQKRAQQAESELSARQAEIERLRGTIHVLENALEKYVFCRHAIEGCICTKEARTAQSILAEEPK